MNRPDTKAFEQRIAQDMRSFHMTAPGDGVVAGVSGGADSVCLLRVLARLRREMDFTLTAVHVEHGLRGESALEDAEFTRRLCEQLGVPCRIFHVQAAKTAKEQGLTVEEAGRMLRYQAFEQVREETGASRIATAHHAEDQAETMLLNLARGTGLTGIGGIRPLAENRIRPLLFVQREEIEAYLRAVGQTWRTDETNGETAYARNRIRLQIMPVLREQINAQTAEHFGRAALDVQRCDDYLNRQARIRMEGKVLRERTPEGGQALRLPTDLILQEEELLQEYILRLALKELRGGLALKDISRKHIDALKKLAAMDCGRSLDLPVGLYGVREKDMLVLRVKNPEGSGCSEETEASAALAGRAAAGRETELVLPLSGSGADLSVPETNIRVHCRVLQQAPDPVPQKRYTKWLGYDTMGGDICLRTRRTGDYLVVNARGGRKKLKDYLIDMKVPRDRRDSVLVAAQGSHVLWVVGGRISEAARAGSGSASVLEITVEGTDPL